MATDPTIVACPSCGQLNRTNAAQGRSGVWRCGTCGTVMLSTTQPRQHQRTPWRLVTAILIFATLAIGGLAAVYHQASNDIGAWEGAYQRADKALVDGEFARSKDLLSEIEKASSDRFWRAWPVRDASVQALLRRSQSLRQDIEQAERLQGSLVILEGYAGEYSLALRREDVPAAERALLQIQHGMSIAPPKSRVVSLQAKLETASKLYSNREQPLSALRGWLATTKDWEDRISAAARSLSLNDIAGAGRDLAKIAGEIADTRPVDAHFDQSKRLDEIRTKSLAALTAVGNQRAKYIEAIAAIAAEIERELLQRNFAAIRTALNRAADSHPHDPAIASLASMIARMERGGAPAGAEISPTLKRVVRDAVAWSGARIADTTARYVEFLKGAPDSPFADEARARIVDLEVADIRKGQTGALPPARELGSPSARRTYSLVNIFNDTAHELTVRYSGPDSFKIVFQPREKGSIEILVGNYVIAASVSASHVRNYAGEQRFGGGNHEVTYYIRTEGLPYLLPPVVLFPPLGGSSVGFVPWTSKRALPAYLK